MKVLVKRVKPESDVRWYAREKLCLTVLGPVYTQIPKAEEGYFSIFIFYVKYCWMKTNTTVNVIRKRDEGSCGNTLSPYG